jgi:Transcriptional regulator, AbiEi antitoxin
MRPELKAFAAGQAGVFLRRQANLAGYDDKEISRLVRRGQWTRLRRGAYCESTLIHECGAAKRHLLAARAVMLVIDPPAHLSHDTAAAALGLPTWGLPFNAVHLTRTPEHSGRRVAGVNHHEAWLSAEEITDVDGLSVTTLERTALDIGRAYGFQKGVVAADAALHLGADHDTMRQLVGAMRDWPGSREANAAVEFATVGAHSPGESLTRIATVEAGLRDPQPQFEVRDLGFLAYVDLVIPDIMLAIEFDGRVKYQRTRDAVDGPVDDADVVWAEKRREDRLRELGYEVVRVIWSELFGASRVLLIRRLKAAAERARRRGARFAS